MVISVAVFFTTLVGILLSLTSEKHYLLIPTQIVLYCIIGSVFLFLPKIAEFDKANIAKETFAHFIVTAVIFFPIASIAFVKPKSVSFLILVFNFILIYVAIWLIQYCILKYKIQKINEKLFKK